MQKGLLLQVSHFTEEALFLAKRKRLKVALHTTPPAGLHFALPKSLAFYIDYWLPLTDLPQYVLHRYQQATLPQRQPDQCRPD